MNTPQESLQVLMAQAAEFRAVGATWEMVAARVGRTADACRRWQYDHPEEWRRLVVRAKVGARDEGGGESIPYLRKLLRSKDERICLGAARVLLKCSTDLLILEVRALAAETGGEGSSRFIAAFVKEALGLSDDDYHDLLRKSLAERPPPPGLVGPGGGRPPGPEGPQ